MTGKHKPISPLRQRMIENMTMHKLGEKAQRGYIRAVKVFTCYPGSASDTANAEDLRRYQLHMSRERRW